MTPSRAPTTWCRPCARDGSPLRVSSSLVGVTEDLDALRQRWVGSQIAEAEVTIDPGRLVDWARACGESQPRFLDPHDPDFQAHPTFPTCINPGRMLPEDFPALGGRSMDGGKAVVVHTPIRAGDALTARSVVADIYEKTGRSGTMTFIVQRTTFTNQ